MNGGRRRIGLIGCGRKDFRLLGGVMRELLVERGEGDFLFFGLDLLYLLIIIYWSQFIYLSYMTRDSIKIGDWKINLTLSDIEFKIDCDSIYERYRLHQ